MKKAYLQFFLLAFCWILMLPIVWASNEEVSPFSFRSPVAIFIEQPDNRSFSFQADNGWLPTDAIPQQAEDSTPPTSGNWDKTIASPLAASLPIWSGCAAEPHGIAIVGYLLPHYIQHFCAPPVRRHLIFCNWRK